MKSLCSVCQDIFLDASKLDADVDLYNTKYYPHHETISDLKAGAEQGCQMCAVLHRSLTTEEKAQLSCSVTCPASPKIDSTKCSIISYRRDDRSSFAGEIWFRILVEEGYIMKMFRIRNSESIQFWDGLRFPKTSSCTNTGSDAVLALAGQWISNCVQNHEKCKAIDSFTQQRELRNPTRLLYVGLPNDKYIKLIQNPFLWEHIEIEGRSRGWRTLIGEPLGAERYMTLSHCWGEAKFLNLTKQNFETFLKGILVQSLPKTFQHAIEFARRIGIRYLWIDSLCIIQDSHEDWQKEASLMAQTYSNAYCNIAATGGSNPEAGCFMERGNLIRTIQVPQPLSRPPSPPPSQSLFHQYYFEKHPRPQEHISYEFEEHNLWDREITNSRLARRAWVLQERLLARRVVHFASDQIFFECGSVREAEAYQGYRKPMFPFGDKLKTDFADGLVNLTRLSFEQAGEASQRQALETWNSLVERYTTCDLKYESDRLPAIAGLAFRMKPLLKCRYIAGLWEYNIVPQLVWRSKGNASRTTSYQAPTWSWASRPGAVDFGFALRFPTTSWQQCVVVEGVEVITRDGKEMSEVINGSLRLKGFLMPAYIDLASERPAGWAINERCIYVPIWKSYFRFIYDVGSDLDDLAETNTVARYYCVPCLFRIRDHRFALEGLVLRPTRRRGQFKRVGLFWCDYDEISIMAPQFAKGKIGKSERVNKNLVSEERFEKYDEVEDQYTLTVI